MSAAVLFLTDLQEGSCAEAGRQGLSRFGNGLALAAACRPDSLPAVGLFSLAKKANRVQLQVKLRPSPFLLSDWHHSVAKLSKGSRDHVDAAQLALALANLLEFLSSQQDAPERSRVVLLCDRPYDDLLLFEHPLQTAKLKNIGIDVMALCSDSDTLNPGVQAATESWRALQAAHLSTLTFTQVEVGDRFAYDNLAARLLQRCAQPPALAVALQFQVPLIGNLRGVGLRAEVEVHRLSHAFEHGSLCPCHHLPTGPPLVCGTTGAVLDAARCEKDLHAVQVGPSPAGHLRFASPLNIGLASAGHATLKVLERAKWGDLNPALLFGAPVTLRADETLVTIMTEEAGMQDVTAGQVLACITEHLSSEDEVLLAASSTDLESGQPGLFKLFYVLLPSDDGVLVAKRMASAEELALAPIRTAPGPQPLPDAAIRQAIGPALGQLPLGKLDCFRLSTTCHQTIEMLVRNSKPTQKAKQPRA